MQPGQFQGRDVTVQDVFEAVGACMAGRMTPDELKDLESRACPGAGACGGQFAANTMSTAMTFLVEDGDTITIDVENRALNVMADLSIRTPPQRTPHPAYRSGVFAKYADPVSSASEGAVTSPPRAPDSANPAGSATAHSTKQSPKTEEKNRETAPTAPTTAVAEIPAPRRWWHDDHDDT
jgi:dihydroxyacid dehydratase/phosphogluconate dehydratase